MLQRLIHAVAAGIRAFRSDLNGRLLPRTLGQPRPVWDNGTDYDVPTFLRRRTE